MKYIELQLLILTIIAIAQAQTEPNWIASPNLFTGKFILVNNPTGSNTNSNVVKSFATSFTSTPQVMLSIIDAFMVSNGNSHGIKVSISGFSPSSFTCVMQYFNNARVYYLNIEYLAYTNATLQNQLHVYFNSYSTTVINASPSSTRVLSQTIVHNPAYSISPYTSITCVPYLTGFEGGSSDYYKLNLTMAAVSNTDIVLTATVDYYTNINLIVYYSLIINKEYLQTSCRYFVDTGSTYAINGLQQTFFTPPKGLFQMGYITGLISITLKENTNFNLSSYGTYDSQFATDTYAIYTQMSHLNFRVRDCVSPYLYYNKLDGLCYNQCPDGTYLINAYLLCQVCHWSCLTCIIDTACATCKANSLIDAGTGYCTCDLKFYLSSQSCVACHYSCRTCSGDQYNQCNTCVGAQYRLLNAAQSTCPCTTGYKDVGQATCQQICGDGLIFTDQCDDGNTDSGDGCSSTCQIEANFSCSSTPSDCIYTGTISLQYVQAEKQPYSNRAKFYIRLSPFINLMSKLAGTDAFFTTTSGLSGTRTQFDSEQNLFIFSGEMSKDFENQNMIIFLKSTSTGPFRTLSQTNTTFTSKSSNGMKLVVYTEQQNKDAENINIASQVFGCLILFSTLFFCFTQWKYIGNQTYFTVQIIFMCLCFLQQFKPILASICGLHYIMGYNGLIGQKRLPYLNQPIMQYMGYSIPYQYNVNFMLIPQGISLILFLIYKIFLYFDSRLDRSQSRMQTWYGKIISIFNFQLFVFWTFVNANNFIISTALQGQDTTYPAIFVYVAVCLLTIVIALIPVLIIPDSVPSYRATPFHKTHGSFAFILTLIGVGVMDILLLLSVILLNQLIYLIPIYPLVMIAYAIFWRPFAWIIDTVRFALNNLGIIIGMCLIYVLYNLEDNTLYVPVGILILIILIVLMNTCIFVALVILHFLNLNKQPTAQQQNVAIKHQQLQQLKKRMDDQAKLHTTRRPLRKNVYQLEQSQNKSNFPFPSRMRPQQL